MPQSTKQAQGSVVSAHRPERTLFRQLLLTNPNYFGNLVDSGYEPVFALNGDTAYEQLACVGYQPQFRQLEAVISVKQISGYQTDICQGGSPEFVRFYLSFDGGTTWVDQGLTSVTVYDIPGVKPLEYSVSLNVAPPETFCVHQNIIKVRSILSWNTAPTANTPDYVPVWGNVLEASIQVQAWSLFKLGSLIEAAELAIPAKFAEVIDLEQQISAAKPKPASVANLAKLYAGKNVPAHRYLMPSLKALVDNPGISLGGKSLGDALGIEQLGDAVLQAAIAELNNVNGDTSFEQLDCVGYNPVTNTIAGTIHVKKSAGYSGPLCSAGSQEYVAFWVDWGDGNGLTYAGTTSVTVHDLSNIPADGLQYAVTLPIDPLNHQQPCEKGAKIVSIRGILSWQQPPQLNPNWVPFWGNRVDVHAQIAPGIQIAPGQQVPFLVNVGGIPVTFNGVNSFDGTGFANCIYNGLTAYNSPFGGLINIEGHISNATPGIKYRVVKRLNTADPNTNPNPWVPVTNEPQGLILSIEDNSQNTVSKTVNADAQGYYTYEDYPPNHSVSQNLMGQWYTTAADDGQRFDLRIDLSVDGNPANDVHSYPPVTVMIDNTPPVAKLDPPNMGTPCGTFAPGDPFIGHFTATDAHFGGYSFVIQPNGPATGVLPQPSPGSYPMISDPGIDSTYTLNTGPMAPCGYSLTLNVSDRTIVNSGPWNNTNSASIGFCLRTPGS